MSLKSKRWPWLTEGWYVVEDIERDRIARTLLPLERPATFFMDYSIVFNPYIPKPKLLNNSNANI